MQTSVARLTLSLGFLAIIQVSAWANQAIAMRENYCAQLQLTFSLNNKLSCLSWFVQNTQHQSSGGYPLLAIDLPARKFTPQASTKSLKVLLINGIHGNEHAANWTGLQWIDRLIKFGHQAHWRIIPIANPDGVFAQPQKRTNTAGIDINRNFMPPSKNPQQPYTYWRENKLPPPYFPGIKPFDQSESQLIKEQIQDFNPHVVIALHTPYGYLDFDGPSQLAPTSLFHLDNVILATPPGSLGNYAWNLLRIPVLTIEFNSSILHNKLEHYFWLDLLNWLAQLQQGNVSNTVNASDDIQYFKQVLQHISNQNLASAISDFNNINDSLLSAYANNNLAYLHLFRQDLVAARKRLQQNLRHSDVQVRQIAQQNLQAITANPSISELNRLSQFTILYLPNHLESLQNQTQQLRLPLRKLLYSMCIKDQRVFSEISKIALKLPEKKCNYVIIRNITYSNNGSNKEVVSDIKADFYHANRIQHQQIKATWKQYQQNWLLQQLRMI